MSRDAIRSADQYLRSAHLLLEAGDYRSSVSRSYYAMFYVTRALLRDVDVRTKTHSGLRRQFGLHFVKSGRIETRFARMLDTAEDMRAFAEYAEDPDAVDRMDAEQILNSAEEYVERMRDLLNA
jgi:uncharacterized protein (UPF0332 family)